MKNGSIALGVGIRSQRSIWNHSLTVAARMSPFGKSKITRYTRLIRCLPYELAGAPDVYENANRSSVRASGSTNWR